jgi:hypothetical protein
LFTDTSKGGGGESGAEYEDFRFKNRALQMGREKQNAIFSKMISMILIKFQ